jgi:nitrogen regulatory protein PII
MKIVMAIIKPFKLEEVRDALTAKTIEAITSAAKTGQIGDGKIFVINLENAVRIRTGEADAAAL